MQGVVQPLFGDVSLYDAGEQDGRGANREEKTGRGGEKKQRQNIFQLAADVLPIEWPHVMIRVKRVKSLVQETPDQAFAGWETAVKDIAVEEVFDESPGHATRCEERQGGPGVLCRKRDEQRESRVQSVEDGQGIKPIASESGLTPLVDLKGDFRSPRWLRRNKCEL